MDAATKSDARCAVVIGFRDWGIDRLVVAVERLAQSSMGKDLDVVVSDYGSQGAKEVRDAVEAAGGRVVRTSRQGPWSRSRALNAGVEGTDTEFVITTDADMIFTRSAVENLVNLLGKTPKTAFLVQCRDLNESFGAGTAEHADDTVLEKNSQFRPRWGMGGLIAFRRSDFDLIGGYDARMEIYGGEDIDFAQRLVRSGLRLNWIDDPATRIYHIWHTSTADAVNKDAEQKQAQDKNRDIMLNDTSWLRNVNLGNRAGPVASVLIATHNRADYLMDSVNSTLAQTIQDLEIIILDDGSSDHTRDVLAAIDDPRVRYLSQANMGVAHTRNRLVHEARSSMIVVHDDDDIMLPWRVEAHLRSMRDDIAVTYGGWVDFENDTGQLEVHPGREYAPDAFMYAGKILSHGTSMFRTELMRRFAYREHLRSGVDFNLIVRMANAGYRFRHTGELHILRRMHGMNLTHTIQDHQKKAAVRTTTLLRRRNSPERERQLRHEAAALKTVETRFHDHIEDEVAIYLPDHLASRDAHVTGDKPAIAQLRKAFGNKRGKSGFGWVHDNRFVIRDVTLGELVQIRKIPGVSCSVVRSDRGDEDAGGQRALLRVLPTSGLLNPDRVTLVSIARVEAPGTGGDSEERRTRYWFDGVGFYRVDLREASQAGELLGLADDSATTLNMLFHPEYGAAVS